MPQLDLFTFFPQIFWGFLFFFIQFFILSYYFLPLLASSVKFRSKYLMSDTSIPEVVASVENADAVVSGISGQSIFSLVLDEFEEILGKLTMQYALSIKATRLKVLAKTFGNINSQVVKMPFAIDFGSEYVVNFSYVLGVFIAANLVHIPKKGKKTNKKK